MGTGCSTIFTLLLALCLLYLPSTTTTTTTPRRTWRYFKRPLPYFVSWHREKTRNLRCFTSCKMRLEKTRGRKRKKKGFSFTKYKYTYICQLIIKILMQKTQMKQKQRWENLKKNRDPFLRQVKTERKKNWERDESWKRDFLLISSLRCINKRR